jgi:hypothetical protein
MIHFHNKNIINEKKLECYLHFVCGINIIYIAKTKNEKVYLPSLRVAAH